MISIFKCSLKRITMSLSPNAQHFYNKLQMFYDEIDTLSDEYIQSMKLDKVKEVYVQYYEIHHQLVNILFADEIYFKDTNQQQSLTKTREVMEEMTEEMHNIQKLMSQKLKTFIDSFTILD